MLLTTPGLVLRTTAYGDTSVIASIFTRSLGVRPYIIKGVRSSRGRAKMNLLQPLSYLDLVVYDSPKANINYIKEMRPAEAFPAMAASPVCASLVFFMDELLYKVLREGEPNEPLFDHTVQCLRELDSTAAHPDPSFPIHFLLAAARHIGIAPLDNYTPRTPHYSLEEGQFTAPPSLTTDHSPLTTDHSSHLLHLYLSGQHPTAPLPQRVELINLLIRHFQIHLADFGPFRSHEVLHTVLA